MSKSKSFFIKGLRLELHSLTPEDVGNFYLNWMNDSEVVRFTEARHKNYTQENDNPYFGREGLLREIQPWEPGLSMLLTMKQRHAACCNLTTGLHLQRFRGGARHG